MNGTTYTRKEPAADACVDVVTLGARPAAGGEKRKGDTTDGGA